MTLTAIIGALVALVARAKPPEREPHEIEIERLKRRIDTLESDNAGLCRELAAERNLTDHWMMEAARIARHAREEREQQAQALGFCNCVPSRSQVWAAHPSDLLVAQLNRVL